MKNNADVTIYNKFIDTTTTPPSEKYLSTQVRGVAWENRKASNILATGGNVRSDQASIYIPVTRGADYLGPVDWWSETVKGDYWTLQIGDVIVRGLIDDEISANNPLSTLKGRYNDVLIITSVDLLDNGSRALSHWKVGAG